MTECTTTDCEQPTHDYLCAQCVTDLQAWIDRVPDTRAELFTTMAKLDATAPKNHEGGGGLHTGSAMPLREGAMETRYALAFWEGTNAAQLAKDQYAGGFLPMLKELIDKAEKLMDNPTEIHVFGKCGAETPDGECAGTLTAEPETVWTNCPECEAPHNIRERIGKLHEEAKGQPLPPREVREYLASKTGIDVSTKDIKNWVQLRKLPYVLDRITVADKDRDRGRRIYYPGDVFRIYQSMKERRRLPA